MLANRQTREKERTAKLSQFSMLHKNMLMMKDLIKLFASLDPSEFSKREKAFRSPVHANSNMSQ